MDNEAEILVNAFLDQVAELKAEDSNKLIRGDAGTLEKYNWLVGRIKAFSHCESIISDLLKQSE